MDVYYNGNGNIWGKGLLKNKLTEFPLRKTFLWGTQEVFLPSLYVGKPGTILDVCIKIPLADMTAFLKKWPKERRLSLKNQEDYEQIDTENPCSILFSTKIHLNDIPLTQRMSSSMVWYPEDVFRIEDPENLAPAARDTDSGAAYEEELPKAETLEEEWRNDKDAEKLMQVYGCSRDCCWLFQRCVYNWADEKVLSPRKISLLFHENPHSVTTEHFTTDTSLSNREIRITHPQTEQEYLLTLYDYEQDKISFNNIGEPGLRYPEHYYALTYTVSPEIGRDCLHICDCVQSEQPVREDGSDNSIKGGGSGPTSVFVAGKSPVQGKCLALSSLHFEPVAKVQWRVVFEVPGREDLEISFEVEGISG